MTAAKLKPALLACLVMLAAAGCGSTNLGDIDETPSERDDMPGPGIFADEDGESTLKWSTDGKPSAEEPAQTPAVVASDQSAGGSVALQASPAASQEARSSELDEKSEFEAYKEWRKLRAEGVDSQEYREFLLWLEYREFKAGE